VTENKDKIAYCGIYCGDCFIGQGKVADLARDLRKELRKYRVDKMAESFSEVPYFTVFKDYPQCYDVLGALVKLRCNKTCREGGGPPFCKMRKCCQKKGIEGCWECEEFETCRELDFVKTYHGDAHLKNLRKLKKAGVEGFLAGKKYWYAAPSRKEND
jgi:hypothetical protein